MEYLHYLKLFILLNSVTVASCWQYFTAFTDIMMDSSEKDQNHLHTSYYFGECKRKDIRLHNHVYLDHLQVLGKLIVRGWVDLYRIPVCIRLQAFSHSEDLFRSTLFNFQMCVPRISYCHTQNRYKYYYYEWYIPFEMIGGMNWLIMFFGPTDLTWGE